MTFSLKDGIWPTMLTLYRHDNKIDYSAMNELIEWYKSKGVDGLFAVCQSSEMFFLTLEERVELARFIKEKAGNDLQVIASGHISESLEDQITEIQQITDAGIDAFVLVSNRLAGPNESDEVFKARVEQILNRVPEVNFGIYECPFPYKRLVSPVLLKWLADTDRFYFLKDTCCDLKQIDEKVKEVKGTRLKIFNANSATLLKSYQFGVSGYSGVMANFHPELYKWLFDHWTEKPRHAENLQAFLGMASLYELQHYPVNAKFFVQLEGISNTLYSRSKDASEFSDVQKIGVEQLRTATHVIKEELQIYTDQFPG